MTLGEYIDAVEAPTQTVTVLNRRQPDPVYGMLMDFFEPMSVEVRETDLDVGRPADAVVLHDGEEPIAVSSLETLYHSALGFNVDRYATGTSGLSELETPEVITRLRDVRVPGDRENKFVLTQVSRHVEAMSYATGGGQLHSSFQRLSRLTGERGTRRVYQELGERGIDAHVYGVPDDLPRELPVTSHTDRGEEIRRSWFVAHDGGGNDEWKAALVAQEGGPNTYRGFWTFDAATVDEIVAYVTERYPPAE